MNTTKNRISKTRKPENIQVIIPATSIMKVMRRYKKITWPVAVTIRDQDRSGTLFFLRDKSDLEAFQSRVGDLQVAYFGKVRDEMFLDLGRDARVSVRYRSFRKPWNAELLSMTEIIRYFLYRTGDLVEPS